MSVNAHPSCRENPAQPQKAVFLATRGCGVGILFSPFALAFWFIARNSSRLFAALALSICATSWAADPTYVPGEILVGFKVASTADDIAQVERINSLIRIADFPHIRVRHYRLPSGLTVEQAIETLSTHPAVAYVEPNFYHQKQALPSDPRFPDQWYLRNTGQTVNKNSGPAGEDINWTSAMDIFSGTREVIVAVVDSGAALDHPELIDRVWTNAREIAVFPNGVDDDGNGYTDDAYAWDFFDGDAAPFDENGHGTLVASLIAAKANNGHGGVGVSPTARVMVLRVANDFGALGLFTTTNVMQAFTYAAVRGARIINASFTSGAYSASVYSTIQWLNAKGVLLVAAAGNGGDDSLGDNNDAMPTYPASYNLPNIISVAATDRSGALAPFSNYGAISVHIAAPGTDIFGANIRRVDTFREEFATGAPGWITGVTTASLYDARWSIFTDLTGRHWAVDSQANYLPFVDSWLMSPPITTGVGTQITYRRYLFLNWGDCFSFEISTDGGITWNGLAGTIPTCGPINWDSERTFDMSQYDFQTIRVRFRFASDGFFESDGVYLDWFAITNVQTFAYDGTQYQYGEGTSFAAPLVSGGAALIWSQRPDLTVSQVRQILLSSASQDSRLAGKVSSGGKLNIHAALQAAIAAPSGLTLSADSIDFFKQAVGFSSAAQSVTLRNDGATTVNITSINTSDSAIFPGTETCPTSLLPGGSCTLATRFVPGGVGEANGFITITSDALGNPHVLNVVGVGVSVDTVPNAFSFASVTGVQPLVSVTSNSITVSGINAAAAISISGSGGAYSINGGTYTTASGTVNDGNTVTVRLTSSGSNSAQSCTTLNIGGVQGAFCVTTQAAPADTTPDVFSFTPQSGVALNTTVTSNTVTVSGINAAAAISISGSGGAYSINGGTYTTASGTVNDGNTVTVRLTSSGSNSAQSCTTLNIGGVQGAFCVTTQAAPDIQAPTLPTGFAAIPVGPAQINLSWSGATDNVGVTQYKIYRDGSLVAAVNAPATGYGDTGLTASTAYTYTVAACDAAGNCSAQSVPVSATTLAPGQYAFTPELELGWNLMGNSLNASIDMLVIFGNQDALTALTSNIVSIWKWNAADGRWAFYSPQLTAAGIASFAASKGYEVLSTINPGEGYWVNALLPMMLPAQSGTGFNWTGINFSALPSGFNLIAHAGTVTPSQFNINVSATPPSPGMVPTDNFVSLWAWDAVAGNWYFYSPLLEASGGLAAVKSYADTHFYLHFQDYNKQLGIGTGFWVNRP